MFLLPSGIAAVETASRDHKSVEKAACSMVLMYWVPMVDGMMNDSLARTAWLDKSVRFLRDRHDTPHQTANLNHWGDFLVAFLPPKCGESLVFVGPLSVKDAK